MPATRTLSCGMAVENTVNYRHNALIARAVGALAIALGFVLGIYGLDHPGSIWLRSALGLIVTGMLAQGYALYCTLVLRRNRHPSHPPS